MSYSVEQVTTSSSTAFLSDIYNILRNYSGDLFDEVELNQTIEGTTIVENNLIFKKDNIDMIKMDMPHSSIASSSSNKISFLSKNSADSLQTSAGWSTSNSGKIYVIQTPYCIAIHCAATTTTGCTALIISKTQLNTLGVYYKGGSTALSYGFDNIVIDPISTDQYYSTSNSIMTQMLPIAIITPSSNEYMSNVYSIIKSQGISNSFREVRLGLRNFITEGRIAYEI